MLHLFSQTLIVVFIKRDPCIHKKGKTICMKWTKRRQISIPYNALRRHISNDAHKYSTSLKSSFTCFAGKKGERWYNCNDHVIFLFLCALQIC